MRSRLIYGVRGEEANGWVRSSAHLQFRFAGLSTSQGGGGDSVSRRSRWRLGAIERERGGERGEGGEVEGSRNVYSTLMMTQL